MKILKIKKIICHEISLLFIMTNNMGEYFLEWIIMYRYYCKFENNFASI